MLTTKDILSIEKDFVEVEFCNLDEGYFGTYDPEDPEDVNFLRFDVSYMGEPVEDASYCTQIPADTDDAILVKLLNTIMLEVHEPLKNGHSIKKICERLSWLDERGVY